VNADIPYLHGMMAFAYEQCHLLDEAESEARAALEMRRKEPWAQHALAHVLLTRGRIDEGRSFSRDGGYLDRSELVHVHAHRVAPGSVLSSQGRDGRCWSSTIVTAGESRRILQDQIGAVSLLARWKSPASMSGPRWQDLGRHLAHARMIRYSFLTLHTLRIGTGGRPEADTLLESCGARRDRTVVHARGRRDVALPGCEGLYAYRRGDYRDKRFGGVHWISRVGAHAQPCARDARDKRGRREDLSCGVVAAGVGIQPSQRAARHPPYLAP